MPDRMTVACPDGHQIQTAVRGRSTTCPWPGCGRRVYVRTDGTTRHALTSSPGGAAGDGGDQTAAATTGGEPFRWGRHRWDAEPTEVDSAEYDPRADRTKLYDEAGAYLGWMVGDPYDLAEAGDG